MLNFLRIKFFNMKQFNKFAIAGRILYGFFLKWMMDLKIIRPVQLKKNPESHTDVIVTLTSYGRRVSKSIVYYTLISLLRQSTQPDKIVLWLDKNTWNINNLPAKISKLQDYGVEILFCEDIRSYKKLIPSLSSFENSILITVDDDSIYKSDIVESLLSEHKKSPNDVISRHARFPRLDSNGFISYNKWPAYIGKVDNEDYIMPIGASGILYPPNCFDDEVLNKNIFQSLCPIADDIWFWAMAKRNGRNHKAIAPNVSVGYPFDDLYQYFHKGSALTHTNSAQNQNDVQLKKLMDYYNLNPNDLSQKTTPTMI